MSETIKHISQLTDIHDSAAIIDFWAPWCGPCKMLAPELDKVAAALTPQVGIYKVNVDENPDLASQFGVTGVPTMVFLKDGQEVNRIVGYRPGKDVVNTANSTFQS